MNTNITETDKWSIGRTYAVFRHTAGMSRSASSTGTVWSRIKEALKDAKRRPTQNEAAAIAKVRQPSVSDWNKPDQYPSIESTVLLARTLGVCVEWIYTGRGPKRPGTALDQHAERLLRAWPLLNDETKAHLVGYAEVSASMSPSSSPRLQRNA